MVFGFLFRVHNLVLKIKCDISWLFYFDKNLFEPVVFNHEERFTPSIWGHCRHDQSARRNFQKRFRNQDLDFGAEVGFLKALIADVLCNKNIQAINCPNRFLLSLKENKAHVKLNGFLWLQIIIDVFESTDHRYLLIFFADRL